MAKLHLKVVTPTHVLYDDDTDFVVLRTLEGEKGILPGHETCGVILDYGLLKIYQGKEMTESLSVLGGFAIVDNNEVKVLSTLAERPEDMDRLRTQRARFRAEALKQQKDSDISTHRAQLMLRRALVSKEFSGSATPFLENEEEINLEEENKD